MPIYQVTSKLHFADKKAAENPDLLKIQGITHIVSVAGSPKKCEGIQYHEFKFVDNTEFEIKQALNAICQLVGGQYAKPKCKLLVHCLGGLSRSPSVVVGMLMMLQGLSYVEAQQLVLKARPSVHMHFVDQLKKL